MGPHRIVVQIIIFRFMEIQIIITHRTLRAVISHTHQICICPVWNVWLSLSVNKLFLFCIHKFILMHRRAHINRVLATTNLKWWRCCHRHCRSHARICVQFRFYWSLFSVNFCLAVDADEFIIPILVVFHRPHDHCRLP